VTKIVSGVLEKNGVPGTVAGLVTGGRDVGEAVVQSQEVDMGEYRPSHSQTNNLKFGRRPPSFFHWKRESR
jgi:hypothetical protein